MCLPASEFDYFIFLCNIMAVLATAGLQHSNVLSDLYLRATAHPRRDPGEIIYMKNKLQTLPAGND